MDKKIELIGFSDIINEDSDFIPLLSSEDEEQMNAEQLPDLVPILPIRNSILFPGVVLPITIGRDKSIKLIEEAYKGDRKIGVVAQKDQTIEDPSFLELNKVGTLAYIIRKLKMPDGSTTIIIQGKKRFTLKEVKQTSPYFKAKIEEFNDGMPAHNNKNFIALIATLKDMALSIIKLSPNIPSEASFALKNIESSSFLVNFISANMQTNVENKQKILEVNNLEERAKMVLKYLSSEIQMLRMKNEIQSKVKVDIDQQQREFFLHQQMKTIQDELGENPAAKEIDELKERSKDKKWPEIVEETFTKELNKLSHMNPAMSEYGVQSNYLNVLLDLPWQKYSTDNFDLKKAQKKLDKDHWGLEKVKERIIEYLAVLKLKNDMKSPILCLVGPPGVGKTSLGKSIASAIGRKYIRMSLGGIHDEAEIRGHRKTYIGAMPGKVIQNIKKAGTSNPVFVLDEIDKVGTDFRGDPSSALLEVLDPEQNNSFMDNFVELEYDLSKVMFIATANGMSNIQPALRDRMEVIFVDGYSVEEKIEIALRHLIPRKLEEHGVKKKEFKLSKKVIEKIIEDYTYESGVRTLEKRIAKLIRYRARQIAMDEKMISEIKLEQLDEILGASHSGKKYEDNKVPGVVTGLAWTQYGGIIMFIEASITKGKGQLTLTGNLGTIMKESAMIAREYLQAHAQTLGLGKVNFKAQDLHIHVPEGATPKDGPSAGITMLTAIASAISKRKVRKFVAMTGEITLRGKVLPVGGIKEKILAAKRSNIKKIILCAGNKKDIDEINPNYIKGMKFHYVTKIHEVLDRALLEK